MNDTWNADTNFERRQAFAYEFRNFDVAQHELYLRSRRTRVETAKWNIQAIKLAQSGRYYMLEIAPLVEKHYPAVAVMFQRLRKLKGVPNTGWPPAKKYNSLTLFVCNGEWRLDDGPNNVAPDSLHDGQLHDGGEGKASMDASGDGEAVPCCGGELEQVPHVLLLRRTGWAVSRQAVA